MAPTNPLFVSVEFHGDHNTVIKRTSIWPPSVFWDITRLKTMVSEWNISKEVKNNEKYYALNYNKSNLTTQVVDNNGIKKVKHYLKTFMMILQKHKQKK